MYCPVQVLDVSVLSLSTQIFHNLSDTSVGCCSSFEIMGSNDAVGWISSPNQRGTIDVLWMCAFTLFICIWTVLHPNIPMQEEVLARWTQWPFWRKRLKPAGLMVVVLVAPELLVALAARDWLWARASVREMRELGFQNQQWSMSHAFYANMGGFVFNAGVGGRKEVVAGEKGESDGSGKKHEFLRQTVAQRGGLGQRSLCATQLAMLIRKPYELRLPQLTMEDLQDRSKSDTLAKLLACMQAGWLVVQCFARAGQHLAVSQLELATAGFVGCTVMTYLFWWNKPRNVESTVPIVCPDELHYQVLELLDGLAISDHQQAIVDSLRNKGRMPFLIWMNPQGRTTTRMSRIIPLLFAAVGAAFSAVHILAWDFHFPSYAEMVIWRSSSVTAAGLCLAIYVAVLARIKIDGYLFHGGKAKRGHVWIDASTAIVLLLTVLYPLVRLLLIVQTFLCFRSMPNTVYDTVDWTRYFSVIA